MRFRLGGWAVAALLVLGGCGVDGPDEDASRPAAVGALATSELVSARDTLPPAPSSATALTVLLTHAGDVADPGLDAAAAALAQRPDIRVVIAAPGAPGADATTMSGFPVTVVDPAGAGLVAATVSATGVEPDLVVIGIDRAAELGGRDPIGAEAVAAGIPALLVVAEVGDVVDHAAAAMQLLEVLDLELDALLDEPAGLHRLTVPSCRAGTLRGRMSVRPVTTGVALEASDCTSADRTAPVDERDAVRTGYASLSQLP